MTRPNVIVTRNNINFYIDKVYLSYCMSGSVLRDSISK